MTNYEKHIIELKKYAKHTEFIHRGRYKLRRGEKMFTPLIITGSITAKLESVELVKAELSKLIETTRNELGCIQYSLHQDNVEHNKFLFYEQWQNRDLWQVHMNADHIQAYLMATDGHVEKFVVSEMTRIG